MSPKSARPSWLRGWGSADNYETLPTSTPPATPDLSTRSSSAAQRRRRIPIIFCAVLLLTAAGICFHGLQIKSESSLFEAEAAEEEQELPVLPALSEQVGTQSDETDSADVVQGSDALDGKMGVAAEHHGMWGLSEDEGWENEAKGLADLGQVGEDVFRLNLAHGDNATVQYFTQLLSFTNSLPVPLQTPLLTSLHSHLPQSHTRLIPAPAHPHRQSPAMISYKSIFQTDKTSEHAEEAGASWTALNERDGWEIEFFDDNEARSWVHEVFGRSDVEWAWRYMHRGVLRADFLRYLLPLIEGGVYSDVDTRPLRPIEQWGHESVEYLDLTTTDGPNWSSQLSTHPSVVVGIDIDVHSHPHWLENGWLRPLGICQWTLSSSPNHPIFLDAVRRVVNHTRVVETWENYRLAKATEYLQSNRTEEAKELVSQGRDKAMSVLEWTGPGMFTDSVMAFLLARYNVTWHRLRALDHPLRIGDVLILPITAFSPGGEPDFHAEPGDSIQADVIHGFRGSWKGDGARSRRRSRG